MITSIRPICTSCYLFTTRTVSQCFHFRKQARYTSRKHDEVPSRGSWNRVFPMAQSATQVSVGRTRSLYHIHNIDMS